MGFTLVRGSIWYFSTHLEPVMGVEEVDEGGGEDEAGGDFFYEGGLGGEVGGEGGGDSPALLKEEVEGRGMWQAAVLRRIVEFLPHPCHAKILCQISPTELSERAWR